MAVYCCKECEQTGPVCDYCAHYDFNGDANGFYTGDGWCKFHEKPIDPLSGCDDYVCFQTVEPEEA